MPQLRYLRVHRREMIREKRTRQLIRSYINSVASQVFERDHLVEGMALSLITHFDMAIIGPPGRAKTSAIEMFVEGLRGAKLYKKPCSKFTEPEHLLGPADIQVFKDEGRFVHRTKGFMPEADVAVLEEGFELARASQDALLLALSNRVFEQDGELHPMLTRSIIVPSNKLPPQGSGFWDRFQVRYYTDAMLMENVRKMVDGDLGADWSDRASHHDGELSMLTFVDASHYASVVPFSDSAWAAFEDLVGSLKEARVMSLVDSDRRKKYAARWLQAAAWLSGQSEITVGVVKQYMLPLCWGSVDEIAKVVPILRGLRDVDAELAGVIADFNKFRTEYSRRLVNVSRMASGKTAAITMSKRIYTDQLRGILRLADGLKKDLREGSAGHNKVVRLMSKTVAEAVHRLDDDLDHPELASTPSAGVIDDVLQQRASELS